MDEAQPNDLDELIDQARTAAQVAEEERLAKELEQNDLRWVMNDKRGRRVVHRLLGKTGIYQLGFDLNHAQMSFNAGMRNVGLELQSEVIEACSDRYMDMLTEQKDVADATRNRRADRRNKRA